MRDEGCSFQPQLSLLFVSASLDVIGRKSSLFLSQAPQTSDMVFVDSLDSSHNHTCSSLGARPPAAPTSLACGAAPRGCRVSPGPGTLLRSPSRAPPTSSAPLPLGVRGLGESPLPGQPLPAASPLCLPLGSRLGSGASSCRCQGRLRVQAGQVDPTSKGLLCLLVAPLAWLYIPCFTLGCFVVLARPGRSSALRPCSSLPRNRSTPANRADGTRGALDSTLLELATGCSC